MPVDLKQRAASARRPRKASADSGRSPAAPGWLFRCAPGLSKILVIELRFNGLVDRRTRPTILWQRNHDLVFLPRLLREPRPTDLRIAEEIHRCPVYGRYKVSHHQLDVLADLLRKPKAARRLAVSVDGTRFNRHEQARWLTRELTRRGVVLDDGSDRLVHLFCVEESYYVGLPYRAADETALRQRRKAEREGSLPPTIAAAMAFLANPQDADAILDPVCGSGTLLAEAHAYAPAARLWGIDSDRKAIAAARRNLEHVPQAELRADDGRATGLPDQSISLFLANLPFGKQFGSTADNPALYGDILQEMSRLGRAGDWRAVVATSDRDAIRAAAARFPALRIASEQPIRIRGEAAAIFLVRTAEPPAGRAR